MGQACFATGSATVTAQGRQTDTGVRQTHRGKNAPGGANWAHCQWWSLPGRSTSNAVLAHRANSSEEQSRFLLSSITEWILFLSWCWGHERWCCFQSSAREVNLKTGCTCFHRAPGKDIALSWVSVTVLVVTFLVFRDVPGIWWFWEISDLFWLCMHGSVLQHTSS